MRTYLLLNQDINNLLNDKQLPSNHTDSYWNVFFDKNTFVTFSTKLDLLQLPPLELETLIGTGSYLVELDVPQDNIISEVPYDSYIKLTRYLRKYKLEILQSTYERTKLGLSFTPFCAIIVDRITRDMVTSVYRLNPVAPYWVSCEIKENKLIHKFA